MSVTITKFGHSCLLVELSEAGRNALFDPGVYSSVPVETLPELHDILITHQHADHMDGRLIKTLRAHFPRARITAPPDAGEMLKRAGVADVQTSPGEGFSFFEAPHEAIEPLYAAEPPRENGVHYDHVLTHPGDSHHFHETMPILALPVTAPWGSAVEATRIALELHPQYVVPIHDWHWKDEARSHLYDDMERRFAEVGIHFLKVRDGMPMVLSDIPIDA